MRFSTAGVRDYIPNGCYMLGAFGSGGAGLSILPPLTLPDLLELSHPVLKRALQHLSPRAILSTAVTATRSAARVVLASPLR